METETSIRSSDIKKEDITDDVELALTWALSE